MEPTLDLFAEGVQEVSDGGRSDDRSIIKQAERGYKWSEKYRHRCEVRSLIAERVSRGKAGRQWLQDFLNKVPARRNRLERDILSQWKLGNRGELGKWEVDSNSLS